MRDSPSLIGQCGGCSTCSAGGQYARSHNGYDVIKVSGRSWREMFALSKSHTSELVCF